jgi:hypothetical protein
VAGLIGGNVLALLVSPPPLGFVLNLVISAAVGVIFGLAFGPKISTAGAGLVWGEAYGVFWWLIGSLTLIPLLSGQGLGWTVSAVHELFPLLLGQVLAYGAVLGLGYYFLAQGLARASARPGIREDQPRVRIPMGQDIVPPLVQAIIIGGLGGLLGSWVFARGIERAEFFPLVAGLMGSNLMMVGQILHYIIGTIIGVSFGVLFFRDVRGVGSGLVWGMNYGLTWWIIGPMTFLPWLLGFGGGPDWSLVAARAAFSALVAHMLYGALVGSFYYLANKLWHVLFIDSDPLNRTVEGVGTRGLRSVLMGQAGGIIGGLLFTIVMVGIGALPAVASLIGARSVLAGFIVHLIISITIGSSYGILFRREAYSYGSGLAWGLVYGLLWWLLGQLTLFPVLLRQPVDWSPATVMAFYPALVGHLLYGTGLGLFFQFQARRYDAELRGRAQHGNPGTRSMYQAHRPLKRRAAGTSAPALWTVTLVLGVILPLLLSMSN